MRLAELSSPQVAKLARSLVVLLPIAAVEQHSHHLPLATDTILVEAVAERVESQISDRVLLLPVQWLGASGHHLGRPGTLSADLPVYVQMLRAPVESLYAHGFRRFLFLNGHGGNVDPLHVASRMLRQAHPEGVFGGASYWVLAQEEYAQILEGPRRAVGHACEAETSMVMALRPDLVQMDEIQDEHPAARPALRGLFLADDFARDLDTGKIGFPSLATPEKGERLLAAAAQRVVEVVGALPG